MRRILSAQGQTFFHFYDEVLRYPADKDVVIVLLEAISAYFAELRPLHACAGETVEDIVANVALFISGQTNGSFLNQLLQEIPQLDKEVSAILALSCIDANIATPIMSQTTASGTLMRKKLEPVSMPILQLISVLTGKTFSASTSRRRSA